MTYIFSIHTDNPVKDVDHFGYAVAYHKIKETIGQVKVNGRDIEVHENDKRARVQLFMGSNPGQFHPNQYKIQMTQWESTMAPANWRIHAKRYNEFWTANQWGAQGIINAGVPEQKVHVYEHGIDSSVWTPKLRGTGNKIRFLHIDAGSPRKRSDVTLEAFKAAFGDNPDYELTLKYGLKTMKYYEKFDNSIVDWNDPNIMANHGEWEGNVRRIQEIMSTEDMVKLYHYHDILVYPSEGEGFGLIPLQALATGMPVICTGRWPSYLKYLNGNVIDTTLGKSKFLNYFDGNVCVPSVEDTKEHMEMVATNMKGEAHLFMEQVPRLTNEYSWFNKTEPVIQGLYRRLKPGYLT